ncbi:MAG: LysR family transcriptional regulator, partial [Syntrophomonadaceae bacterium]|nr:LysR family transcriptional regulator [Syntrophomonadaceae bacterium]
MDFKQLDTFLAVARTGSFSKAAERLFLTQPSVSSHIAQLEEELGTPLFERNNRRTDLTVAGRIFYASALEMVNQRDSTLLKLRDYRGKIDGMIEIGASNIPDQYLLPRYVMSFHRLYPGVTYQLHHMSSREVEEALLQGAIDLGMVGIEPTQPQLARHKIAEDELVAITPAIPPFTEMSDIGIDELLRHDLLLRRDGSASRQVFEQALKKSGLNAAYRPRAYLENNDLIMLYVQQG